MTPCRTLLLLAACALFATGAGAAPTYKCETGGKTTYSDRPCPEGRQSALPPMPVGVDMEGKNTPVTRDARTLLELEKMRIAREERALRDDKAAERAAHAGAAKRKQCARLKLRHKWAQEDAARAQGGQREAALRKTRRHAETLAVECPA